MWCSDPVKYKLTFNHTITWYPAGLLCFLNETADVTVSGRSLLASYFLHVGGPAAVSWTACTVPLKPLSLRTRLDGASFPCCSVEDSTGGCISGLLVFLLFLLHVWSRPVICWLSTMCSARLSYTVNSISLLSGNAGYMRTYAQKHCYNTQH